MNSYILKTTGEKIEKLPSNGTDFTLEEMQEIVGGYIQVIHTDDFILICNEEGKLQNLDMNVKATNMVKKHLFNNDFIVGDVLVTIKEYYK